MAWATPSAIRWRDAVMLEGRPDKVLFWRMTMVWISDQDIHAMQDGIEASKPS